MVRAAPQRYGDVLVTWGDPWDTEPCDLLPAAAFAAGDGAPAPRADLRRRWGAPDEETGENSHTVTWRFFSSCAGWNPPPTAAELHHAVRTSTPDARQQAVIRKWLGEATPREFVLAWVEEAYGWEDLVAAAHRVGFRDNRTCRMLNQFARGHGHGD